MSRDIRINARSTIPAAKGMANGIADIVTMTIATAQYLGRQLDEFILTQLCILLEPTDSTIFRQPMLFDHNDASTQIACEAQPQLSLLVPEGPKTLFTADYHRTPRQLGLLAGAPALKRTREKVQKACINQNPYRIGEVATLNAIASQLLLPEPNFDSLLALVEECDLYGANVMHSGSIVGLILNRERHDVNYIERMLAQKKLTEHQPKQHLSRMAIGGVELQ